MRHRPNQWGFTIIETLIFLTVSASVFAGAITQYTSQQHNVQFNQGVRDIQSRLQSMINEVVSSYAPSIQGYKCFADNNNSPLVFTADPGSPDNSGCVFLGKAIGVGNDSVCNRTNIDACSRYSIVPIAARRTFYTPPGALQGQPANTFAEAKPQALATCITNDNNHDSFPCGLDIMRASRTARPDLADRGRFSNVGIYRAFLRNADGSSKQDIGAVAFVLGLNRSSSDTINSVDMVWLNTAFVNNTESRVTDAIDNLGASVDDSIYTNPKYGVSFCVMDGYGHQSVILLGTNNSQLDVQVKSLEQDGLASGCI